MDETEVLRITTPSCSAPSRSRPRLDRLVLPLSFLLCLFASWCIGQALLVCVPLLLACPRCLGLVFVPSVPTTTSPYHVTTHYPLPRARYGRDGPPRSLLSHGKHRKRSKTRPMSMSNTTMEWAITKVRWCLNLRKYEIYAFMPTCLP